MRSAWRNLLIWYSSFDCIGCGKAVEVLRAENFAVMLTDVVCIGCPNVAGSLAKVLDYLAAENIFIEYMYAFAQGDTAHVVIRPSNVDRCMEILNKLNCNVLTKIVCDFFDIFIHFVVMEIRISIKNSLSESF